jgi:hypothetical protein
MAQQRSLKDVLNRIIKVIPEEDKLSNDLKSFLGNLGDLGFKSPEVINSFWREGQTKIYLRCPDLKYAPSWYITVLEIWSGKI